MDDRVYEEMPSTNPDASLVHKPPQKMESTDFNFDSPKIANIYPNIPPNQNHFGSVATRTTDNNPISEPTPAVADTMPLLSETIFDVSEGNLEGKAMFRGPSHPQMKSWVSDIILTVYEAVLLATYYAATILLAPFAVIIVGILAGLIGTLITWLVNPFFSLVQMLMKKVKVIVISALDTAVVPLYDLYSSCCSKIVFNYRRIPHQTIHV